MGSRVDQLHNYENWVKSALCAFATVLVLWLAFWHMARSDHKSESAYGLTDQIHHGFSHTRFLLRVGLPLLLLLTISIHFDALKYLVIAAAVIAIIAGFVEGVREFLEDWGAVIAYVFIAVVGGLAVLFAAIWIIKRMWEAA